MIQVMTAGSGGRRLVVVLGLALVLTGCTQSEALPTTVATATLVPVVPTPTVPPTTVPGSVADADEVAETVRQFGAAITRGDQVVALLVLSPSAQQIVAVSDLNTFLGASERPHTLMVHDVRLEGDVALVECVARYTDHEQRLRLQLVRLEGVWKIDARVGE